MLTLERHMGEQQIPHGLKAVRDDNSENRGPEHYAALNDIIYAARNKDHLMTKLEAVIQPSKFEAVKDALLEIGVEGMTVTEVRGHGRQKGHTEFYRGREYTVDLLPKVKIETVMPDRLVEQAIAAVTNAARTGKIGDGKIFLSRVDEAIRIRNEERGEAAL